MVFIWRAAGEVSDSLRKRGGSTATLGFALWELYNRRALGNLAGLPVFVVSSTELIADPTTVCADVATWLVDVGITAPSPPGWDVAGAVATIDPALTHRHPREIGDDLPPSLLDLADRLGALRGPHRAFPGGQAGALSTWTVDALAALRSSTRTTELLSTLSVGNKELSDDHQQLIGTYHGLIEVADHRLARIEQLEASEESLAREVGLLRERIGELDSHIGRLESSASWRITAPLRAAKANRKPPPD